MRPKTPPKTPPHLVRNRRINQFVSPETNRAMRLPNDEFYRNMQKDLLNDFPDFIGPIQKCIENFYYVIYQRDKFDGDHSILSTLLREIESATGIKGKNHHTKAAQQFNIINSTLANLSELLKASKQYADIPEFYLNYLSALNKKLLNSLRKISTDKKLEIIASNGLDVDSPEYSVDLTQEEKLALEQSNPTPQKQANGHTPPKVTADSYQAHKRLQAELNTSPQRQKASRLNEERNVKRRLDWVENRKKEGMQSQTTVAQARDAARKEAALQQDDLGGAFNLFSMEEPEKIKKAASASQNNAVTTTQPTPSSNGPNIFAGVSPPSEPKKEEKKRPDSPSKMFGRS